MTELSINSPTPQAGAIILPTYAGYDNTWCGGSNEILIPDVAGTTYSPLGLPDFSFSVSDSVLSFNSSLCTFQGTLKQHTSIAGLQTNFLQGLCYNLGSLRLCSGGSLLRLICAWRYALLSSCCTYAPFFNFFFPSNFFLFIFCLFAAFLGESC